MSGQHAEMYSRHVCPHLVTFHVHISKTQNIHHAIHLCARCCVAESMSLKKSGKKGIVIKIPPFFIYKNKQNKQILNSFFFFVIVPCCSQILTLSSGISCPGRQSGRLCQRRCPLSLSIVIVFDWTSWLFGGVACRQRKHG